jgi:biotin synthase-related radical SAM superfamily protein
MHGLMRTFVPQQPVKQEHLKKCEHYGRAELRCVAVSHIALGGSLRDLQCTLQVLCPPHKHAIRNCVALLIESSVNVVEAKDAGQAM